MQNYYNTFNRGKKRTSRQGRPQASRNEGRGGTHTNWRTPPVPPLHYQIQEIRSFVNKYLDNQPILSNPAKEQSADQIVDNAINKIHARFDPKKPKTQKYCNALLRGKHKSSKQGRPQASRKKGGFTFSNRKAPPRPPLYQQVQEIRSFVNKTIDNQFVQQNTPKELSVDQIVDNAINKIHARFDPTISNMTYSLTQPTTVQYYKSPIYRLQNPYEPDPAKISAIAHSRGLDVQQLTEAIQQIICSNTRRHAEYTIEGEFTQGTGIPSSFSTLDMGAPDVTELHNYFQTFTHRAYEGHWFEITSYPGCVYIQPQQNNDIPEPELPDNLKDDFVMRSLNSYDMSLQTDYVVSSGMIYMNTQDQLCGYSALRIAYKYSRGQQDFGLPTGTYRNGMPLLVLQTLAELLNIPLQAFILTPKHHHVNCVLGPLDKTKQAQPFKLKTISNKKATHVVQDEEKPCYRKMLGNKLNNLILKASDSGNMTKLDVGAIMESTYSKDMDTATRTLALSMLDNLTVPSELIPYIMTRCGLILHYYYPNEYAYRHAKVKTYVWQPKAHGYSDLQANPLRQTLLLPQDQIDKSNASFVSSEMTPEGFSRIGISSSPSLSSKTQNPGKLKQYALYLSKLITSIRALIPTTLVNILQPALSEKQLDQLTHDLSTSVTDFHPILQQDFPLNIKELKLANQPNKDEPRSRDIIKGFITDKQAYAFLSQAIGISAAELRHQELSQFNGGTAHPVYRSCANAVQFKLAQAISLDTPMVVDIGGKFNTFKYIEYKYNTSKNPADKKKTPSYAKTIIRFPDEPRDIQWIMQNASHAQQKGIVIECHSKDKFYALVKQGHYPVGTTFICHDCLYYMTQEQLDTLLSVGPVAFSYIQYPQRNGCYTYLFNEGYFNINRGMVHSQPTGNQPYDHQLLQLTGVDYAVFDIGYIHICSGIIAPAQLGQVKITHPETYGLINDIELHETLTSAGYAQFKQDLQDSNYAEQHKNLPYIGDRLIYDQQALTTPCVSSIYRHYYELQSPLGQFIREQNAQPNQTKAIRYVDMLLQGTDSLPSSHILFLFGFVLFFIYIFLFLSINPIPPYRVLTINIIAFIVTLSLSACKQIKIQTTAGYIWLTIACLLQSTYLHTGSTIPLGYSMPLLLLCAILKFDSAWTVIRLDHKELPFTWTLLPTIILASLYAYRVNPIQSVSIIATQMILPAPLIEAYALITYINSPFFFITFIIQGFLLYRFYTHSPLEQALILLSSVQTSLSGYYEREKPLSEILHITAHRAITSAKWIYKGIKGTNLWELINYVRQSVPSQQTRKCILSSAQFVDQKFRIDHPFEWKNKSAVNQLAAINNRMCKTNRVPDPLAVKQLLSFCQPIISKIASRFDQAMPPFMEWINQKTGWSQNKKKAHIWQFNQQISTRHISSHKHFKLFLKTGEVYHTRDPRFILPNQTTRSRNIFGVSRDLMGIPTYISEFILRNLAHIMPGFSYKDTIKSYQDKITRMASGKVINDWDGASNDANQHYELRQLETMLIEALPQTIFKLIPLPKELIMQALTLLKQRVCTAYAQGPIKMFLRLKGQLQSGDPATTWSNTFKIILYLNYYLRELKATRNSLGLLEGNINIFVSGDDQCLFCDPSLQDQMSRAIKTQLSGPWGEVTQGSLGRAIDSVHFNANHLELISKWFVPVQGQFYAVRKFDKVFSTSNVKSIDIKSNWTPEEHCGAVATSLKYQCHGITPYIHFTNMRSRMSKGAVPGRMRSKKDAYWSWLWQRTNQYDIPDEAKPNLNIAFRKIVLDTYTISEASYYRFCAAMDNASTIGDIVVNPILKGYHHTQNMNSKQVAQKKQVVKGLRRRRRKYPKNQISQALQPFRKLTRQLQSIRINPTNQYKQPINNKMAMKLLGPYHADQAAYLLSLRHPFDVRGQRVPSEVQVQSAVTYQYLQSTITTSTTSPKVLLLSPGYEVSGDTKTLLSEFLTTSPGAKIPLATVPFLATGNPLSGFSYRVVSMGLKLLCISPPISSEGTVTATQMQQRLYSIDAIEWTIDTIINTPGSTTKCALDKHYITWSPKDPEDKTFKQIPRFEAQPLIVMFSPTSTPINYLCQVVVNYEFLPDNNVQLYPTKKSPSITGLDQIEPMTSEQIIKYVKQPGIWDSVKGGFASLISPLGKAMSLATGNELFDVLSPIGNALKSSQPSLIYK